MSSSRFSNNTVLLAFLALIRPCESFYGPYTSLHRPLVEPLGMMEIWCDARSCNKDFQVASIKNGAPDAILVDEENPVDLANSDIRTISFGAGNELKDIESSTMIGTCIEVKDAAGQEDCLAAIGSVQWILVDSSSWTMIPAENLIATAQSSGTKLAFCVDKSSDVSGLARALELGVDALCVSGEDFLKASDLWKTVIEARRERAQTSTDNPSEIKPQIVVGSCWRRETKSTILADRICVDLVQSLSPDEGCWIGSSAKTMALVLSEAASSKFVPTRPFRINAGPVHSYILLADGSTKYLCELEAADTILVYNSKNGSSRSVAVGRLKEEVRPCVLIEMTADEDEMESNSGQIFLQQAETVRLAQDDGNALRVTDLDAHTTMPVDSKSPLLLRITKTGTHVGQAYSGSVEER